MRTTLKYEADVASLRKLEMEQYWMPKSLDARNLRMCLSGYQVKSLHIRLVGSMGGTIVVNEKLGERKLTFRKDKLGLTFLIDEDEVFHTPLRDYDKGFSLTYERIIPTNDGMGRMVMLPTGVDPYDASLPEPSMSILRTVVDNHLIEIGFQGRVHLKFHSWWQEPHWKYWVVEKTRC